MTEMRVSRGKQLLYDYMDDEQREIYRKTDTTCKYGLIPVIGSAGGKYLLCGSIIERVVSIPPEESCDRICFLPDPQMAMYDTIVSRLLVLQHNEDLALKEALYWRDHTSLVSPNNDDSYVITGRVRNMIFNYWRTNAGKHP